MKKSVSVLTVLAVLAIASCQRTVSLDPAPMVGNDLVADVQVIDGRLKFSSKEKFDKTVQLLAQQQDRLAEFEKKFNGFVSVRTAFNQMTDHDNESVAMRGIGESYKSYVAIIVKGEDKEIARTITDPILATLVSKDGWIYIGNDAYYVTRDQFELVKNRSASKIADVMAGRLNRSDVIHGTVSHQPQNSAGARRADSQTCIQEYFDGSNKRRMAGDIDYEFYNAAGGTFYKSLTIYTKHQRRNFGTYWTQLNAPRLNISGSVTRRPITGGNTIDTFNFGIDNIDQISRSYPETSCQDVPGQGLVCDLIYSNVSSGHSATATTGAFLSCNITLLF
ncbi:hypothetical protein [Spirosoma sp. 209]|uniref:hypothetical protein n=1 Tax=Spirosoma sp. 209 TaxID=1955701 RepID=UPI00098D56B5|nr:hypothetical protein [Spirosoma sp. 209]